MSLPNTADSRNAAIRQLNDAFRTTFTGGRVVLTAGVTALPDDAQKKTLTAVQQYRAFTEDNDPHGEHDFGALEIDGVELFFKIDYYDRKQEYGSEDPADPAVTTRVLTIMKREEY